MLDVILKRFENPDETRTFPKGKFELVRIGGMSIGRATYAPGWRWSTDVGAATGAKMCQVEHVRHGDFRMLNGGDGGWARH